MKILRNILILLIVLIFMSGVMLYAFKLAYPQRIIKDYEINNASSKKKILIASQESEFKKLIVDNLVKLLENDSIYIKIIDVTALSAISNDNWDAIVIINSCEAGKMHKDVSKFIKNFGEKNKIVLLTTSGSGKWKPRNIEIDSISSASKKEDIDSISKELYDKVNFILGKK